MIGLNTLLDRAPHLAAEWDQSGNGSLTPADVTYGSKRQVGWRCRQDHTWTAPVYSRIAGNGCPFCSGFRAAPGRSFADLHPAIASQWCVRGNGELTPQEVTSGSKRVVEWRCARDHTWRAAIYSRVAGNGCPYCAGRLAWAGYNSLVDAFPDKAGEWHPTKNHPLLPTDVTGGSNRKVWWLCNRPGCGNEWQAVIASRTIRAARCRRCLHVPGSRIEKALFDVLIEMGHTVKYHATAAVDAPWSQVDMIVEVNGHAFVAEYDGEWWHRGKADRDIEKTRRLLAAGYSVVRVREHPLPLLPMSDPRLHQIPYRYVLGTDAELRVAIGDVARAVSDWMRVEVTRPQA